MEKAKQNLERTKILPKYFILFDESIGRHLAELGIFLPGKRVSESHTKEEKDPLYTTCGTNYPREFVLCFCKSKMFFTFWKCYFLHALFLSPYNAVQNKHVLL